MKKIIIVVFASICISVMCFGQHEVSFRTSDTALQNAFHWAKEMAVHYKGKPGDAVGLWYESALPPRNAFCIRDVSHQCIGAEILGMSAENKNMFTLFVKNISESKDWCSYWEINKENKPCPDDYRNDKEFWYNLNANFDIIYASWRLYLWTGDKTYIENPLFVNFFKKSVTTYITHWMLNEDSLLTRDAYLNAPVPFNIEEPFHRCHGLPSYTEGTQNLKMGIDLVAAIYRGLLSYSYILQLKGDSNNANIYANKAKEYQKHIDRFWWDDQSLLYNTYYTNDHKFGKTEGETFLLWFDVLNDSVRKQKTIEHLNSTILNVENLSYLPLLMYKNNHWNEAYNYILHLSNPSTERREYPEVSYGVLEGIVQGFMGIDADARYHRVSTMYRGKTESTAEIDHLPILGTLITVKHNNNKKTLFFNEGNEVITWRVKFMGEFPSILVNGKVIKTKQEKDEQHNLISFADIIIQGHKELEASVK